MDVGMDVSNWGCHGASARGMARDFWGFHQWGWLWGKVLWGVAHKRCLSHWSRLANVYAAAEGARVAPVGAVVARGVGW